MNRLRRGSANWCSLPPAQVAHFYELGLRERVLTLPVMLGLVLSMIWRHVGEVGPLIRLIRTESQLWVTPRRITQQALSERLRNFAGRLLAVTLGAAPERDEIYRMGFVDQPAPQFEALNAAKGNLATTLGAQRGHVVVVEFWSPDCVPCRALVPHMNQLHAQYAARGLRVIGITLEPVARAANAAAQLGIEYPVFSDENGRTTMAYQARAIPAVFVIDRTGTVRDVMVGYDARRLPKLDQLVNQLIAER